MKIVYFANGGFKRKPPFENGVTFEDEKLNEVTNELLDKGFQVMILPKKNFIVKGKRVIEENESEYTILIDDKFFHQR